MSEDSLLGRQLDEYRLEASLGRGGMARVYRALDVRLKRYAAIKVIDTPFRADSDYLLRFEREAQAIAQLDHPHIVRLYRFGEADGLLYLAMQYIGGSDLGSVLASYRADGEFIAPEDASRIVREVCLALDYAHGKGVVHRDVKPANIMLDKDGRAILTDFGLALLIEIGTRGEIFGSPHYIAPEQAISSAGAKPQSDLYSVGVMMYEMFTGRLPFEAESSLDIAMLHMTAPPRPPRELRADIHPAVEAVILKALAKEPADRYPNGAALADALDSALRITIARPHLLAALPTLADRVTIALAETPLPPLPAGVPIPPPPAQPRSQETASPPAGLFNNRSPTASPRLGTPAARPGKTRLFPIVSCLGFAGFAALGLIVLGIGMLTGNLSWNLAPTSTPPPGGTLTFIGAGTGQPVAPASNTPTAISTEPVATSQPLEPTATVIPTVSAAALTIVKSGKDGFFVANLSTQSIELGALQLNGKEPDEIEGEKWDWETLQPGECVRVWEKRGEANLPPGLECAIVGKRLTIDKAEKFWSPEIKVVYQGAEIGKCAAEDHECLIPIK